MTEASNAWQNSRVFITGVCGTVGRELLRQVVAKAPGEVVGIDNNESEIFFLRREYADHREVRLYVSDVREQQPLAAKMAGSDYVLHTAAYKHVEICESSPRETVSAARPVPAPPPRAPFRGHRRWGSGRDRGSGEAQQAVQPPPTHMRAASLASDMESKARRSSWPTSNSGPSSERQASS
jgi:hypothetical protein